MWSICAEIRLLHKRKQNVHFRPESDVQQTTPNGAGAQLRSIVPPKVAEAPKVDARRLPNLSWNGNALLAVSCSALLGGIRWLFPLSLNSVLAKELLCSALNRLLAELVKRVDCVLIIDRLFPTAD